jgi:hypothetical protein
MSFQVVVMFHPVGHTHGHVDQLFSRVSTALKKNNVHTFAGTLIRMFINGST